MLQPFEQAGVPYEFYALDEQLELRGVPESLPAGEYVVYVNYFGLKNEYVQQLDGQYRQQLLVDNTQDFFAHGYAHGWGFNSARKAFGVPDGGFLYGPAAELGTAEEYPVFTEYHAGYLIDRLRGAQAQSYDGFVAYEQTLGSEPFRISEFSASLLSQVDYEAVIARRRTNFAYYHAQLKELNTVAFPLELPELPADTVPFCYPLLAASGSTLNRRALFEQNLFIPTLWPDVLTRQGSGFDWERNFTQALLPLPVDHRYGREELDKVIAAVRAQLV
ncbi:DegT/DnrJ/EryC1/StrS family aminotransferase [Hymenobacter cellulosilyticus]|uniref:DegT/DnrJ/EryC1/StrS family aminotransferase n=1 Tax=Hymenobacter cellulosilyticus TaxID=2932248 RepID=A0A8T9QDD3_9BACT|nr:DegT/DnrJ/EryC1/StrS family aminotransferase [Hymenobacter cellulosilyticus]UOQ74421.1 DegT/DnrJ/EryC1/StrS family aminotransferase [Hymenobacter cellulosilyticus]